MEEIKDDENTKTSKQSENKMRTKFSSTSHMWKVSAVIFLVAFVFHLISFGSPFWIEEKSITNSTYIGMWSICSSVSDCSFRNDNSGWYLFNGSYLPLCKKCRYFQYISINLFKVAFHFHYF